MQNKELQDALVSLALGGVATWAIPKYILGPLLAAFDYEVDWWMYLIIFILFAGTAIETLRKSRIENKIAYDKGVAVKPPSDASRFCTQCGTPADRYAAFCSRCGAELK